MMETPSLFIAKHLLATSHIVDSNLSNKVLLRHLNPKILLSSEATLIKLTNSFLCPQKLLTQSVQLPY